MLFAIGLTVVGSAIAGVLPALKVTRGMGSRLKQATAGAGGLQFGGVWTVVIVVQVAVTVAFPAVVYVEQWQLRHTQTFPGGFAAEEYLAVRVEMETPIAQGANTDAVRFAQRAALAPRIEELRRRVEAEPGVAGVTFVDWLPRTFHPDPRIELYDDQTATANANPRGALREANVAGIDPSYFDVLEAPILAGRAFNAGDLAPGARVAIVDQGFVDQVLEGRNAIGQRVRFVQDGEAAAKNPDWWEIVGVVRELGMGAPTHKGRAAGFYFPVPAAHLNPLHMMVHLRGDPLLFPPRLREIVTAVDPTLRLSEFQDHHALAASLPRDDRRRPGTLAQRDLRGPVVHRGATDAGDRHPRGAGRKPHAGRRGHLPATADTGGTRHPRRRHGHRRCGQRGLHV